MGSGSIMPRFFVNESAVSGAEIILAGEDAKHISLSLRSRVGDSITVCDGKGTDYGCEIKDITKSEVVLTVLEKKESETEPDVRVTLYQALVKSDKFDTIVQKCVEIGVSDIVPVVTERCISRPDDASLSKKISRWNKISLEAAKQSGRGIVPTVHDVLNFETALEEIKQTDFGFVCYENTPHTAIDEIYKAASKSGKPQKIAFLIGPEGGISGSEIDMATEKGIPLASLGPRILRTETAPLCVMSVLMMLTGNMQ